MGHEMERRIRQLVAERHGALIGVVRLLRTGAANRDLHRSKPDQERKFELLPDRRVLKSVQEFQGILEMIFGLQHLGALARAFACLSPVADGALGKVGLRVVLGEPFGFVRNRLRKMIFQAGGDARMQGFPATTKKAAIGGIAHKSVLEDVADLLGLLLSKQKPGRNQARQR